MRVENGLPLNEQLLEDLGRYAAVGVGGYMVALEVTCDTTVRLVKTALHAGEVLLMATGLRAKSG